MKYHIPKGTKIRRIRWTGETEEFVTTRDVMYTDSDVRSVVDKEQEYLEFSIPLPSDAGAHPSDPEPKEVSPFKSIKVLKERVEFVGENDAEKGAIEMSNFEALAVLYVKEFQHRDAQREDEAILTAKGRELLANG